MRIKIYFKSSKIRLRIAQKWAELQWPIGLQQEPRSESVGKYSRSCQFSKNETSETYKRKTSRRNIKGSIPPIECPTRIVVSENGEGISVKYFSQHNHELCPQNIKFQPIKKTCREFIKANLHMGIEKSKVLQYARDQKSSNGNADLLRQKELRLRVAGDRKRDERPEDGNGTEVGGREMKSLDEKINVLKDKMDELLPCPIALCPHNYKNNAVKRTADPVIRPAKFTAKTIII
ncbi:hypothetical protein TNCV_1202861 [Trichonephila clavipes]|nr:hypothetical protein TNCV_1202861 [Trichonephila clavipes]